MAKDKKLDPAYKTGMMTNCPYIIRILIPAILTAFLMSCAFPRIIVLDDPLSPEEHINLGVTYEKKGELDNAIEEYKKASKKNATAYLYMGNVFFQKGQLNDSEIAYKKAMKKLPDNADLLNNLAWLYLTKNDNLEEAERLAQKAIELNPDKAPLFRDTLEKIQALRKETR